MFERTRRLWRQITGQAATDDDRRGWQRFPSGRDTTIRFEDDERHLITARVQDVSRGGLRMLVPQPLDAGAMIRIDLPPHNGEAIASVLACIVHCMPINNAEWSIGCSFSTEINDADLSAFGAERRKSATEDKRLWERIPVRGTATIQLAGSGDDPETAQIQNISPTGVALRLTHRLEPGSLINLELRTETGQLIVRILACAVYISDHDGVWIAGCNFIRELDDEDIQKLI